MQEKTLLTNQEKTLLTNEEYLAAVNELSGCKTEEALMSLADNFEQMAPPVIQVSSEKNPPEKKLPIVCPRTHQKPTGPQVVKRELSSNITEPKLVPFIKNPEQKGAVKSDFYVKTTHTKANDDGLLTPHKKHVQRHFITTTCLEHRNSPSPIKTNIHNKKFVSPTKLRKYTELTAQAKSRQSIAQIGSSIKSDYPELDLKPRQKQHLRNAQQAKKVATSSIQSKHLHTFFNQPNTRGKYPKTAFDITTTYKAYEAEKTTDTGFFTQSAKIQKARHSVKIKQHVRFIETIKPNS